MQGVNKIIIIKIVIEILQKYTNKYIENQEKTGRQLLSSIKTVIIHGYVYWKIVVQVLQICLFVCLFCLPEHNLSRGRCKYLTFVFRRTTCFRFTKYPPLPTHSTPAHSLHEPLAFTWDTWFGYRTTASLQPETVEVRCIQLECKK